MVVYFLYSERSAKFLSFKEKAIFFSKILCLHSTNTATFGIVFILFDRYWQISVPYTGNGGNIQITTIHQGLWHRCQTTDQLGTASCDRYYQSIAHLPTSLIGQRALSCIALILAIVGIAAGVASTDGVNMG